VTNAGDLSAEAVSPAGNPQDWDKYELEPGDILFARSGATVGKTYIHRARNGRCVFAGYMIRFRPDRKQLLPDYLFHFTRSTAYKSWVGVRQRVVAQPNINAQQYGRELCLQIPPVTHQEEFAGRMAAIDQLRVGLHGSSAKFDALFASLQQRAFRGEL